MSDPSLKELQARLAIAEEEVRRCDRLLIASRFAGAVIHEVNNPLEALSNLIYLTKTHPDAPPEIKSYMQLVDIQLMLLGNVTRKTLGFYRDQTMHSDHDLVEILESALLIHAARSRSQQIEIRKRIDGPATAKVLAGEILQVLSNLILSSLDAAPTEGAILCVRVKAGRERVCVTIADNGPGIDDSILKTLCEPNRTSKPGGTGFGLWLSKHIAVKHGGKIRVRTSVRAGRNGTAFSLSLPRSGLKNA